MDNPPTKVNLEDSGCVVDGLRSALLDGNVEDQNIMVRRVQSQFFAMSRLIPNFVVVYNSS